MATLPDHDQLAVRGPGATLPGYDRVWAAALTLILIVMVLNLLARAASPGSEHQLRRRQKELMAKRIDVNDLNVYYGDFQAVEDVSMTVEPRTVTAFIGPSGCGKSTLLRTLNRMHEVIPGARVEGKVHARRHTTSTGRASTRSRCAARSAWCSSGRTRSRRCRSTTTSPPACG